MPRIDPRLAAIMGSAVILSTLVVLTIFRAAQPDEITLLRSKCPEVFVKESAQKGVDTSFSFGAITGRNMRMLELRFHLLYEEPPPYEAGWQPDEGTDLDEIASHIPIIASLVERIDELGGDYEIMETDLEINGTEYRAHIYDFSRFLGIFNEDDDLSLWVSSFAVLKRDLQVRFFKGRTGFFLDQAAVLDYLMLSYNDEKAEYLPSDMANAPCGIMSFTDVEKDDKISVIFEVLASYDEIPEIPLGKPERALLQLVKGYADGELSLVVINDVAME